MVYHKHTNKQGFSLIEVLVVAGILALVFGGLLYGYKYTLELILVSRSNLTALTLMNSKMEYIHSLSYDAVGTQGGIPTGAIPQVSTTTLNQIEFQERVLIEYVDDPADGLGGSDSNAITTDYKRVKIEYTWEAAGIPQEMILVSNIVPRSIESNVGGGTLRVNVFDADVVPLLGAEVRVVNTTLSPAIDVTRFTDASGVALFGGAPAGSNYEIFVTGTGYSQDQTYQATTSLPNPVTLPVAVLEADITTMNFFIDELSTVDVRVFADKTVDVAVENFADTSGVATSTDTVVVGGALRLAEAAGVYSTNGDAFLQPITPSPLVNWDRIQVSGSEPTDTTVRWSLYEPTVPPTLVSDSELPGNSAGFALGSTIVTSLSAASYPSLQVGLALTTTDTAVTPTVDEVRLSYVSAATPRASTDVTLISQKSIGTNASQPVPKHELVETTDGAGEATFTDVEWGVYDIESGALTVAEACTSAPVVITPDAEVALDLLLVNTTVHNLRVVVESAAGQVPDATVTLTRSGYNESETTSSCGQAFFSGLTANNDYRLTVTAPGFAAVTIDPFSVASTTVANINL